RPGYRPTWVVLEVRSLLPTTASQRQRQKQARRTSRSRAPRAPHQDTGGKTSDVLRRLVRRRGVVGSIPDAIEHCLRWDAPSAEGSAIRASDAGRSWL